MSKIKLLPFLAFVVLAACTSSRVTHSWKSDYPAKNYSKMLVIAINGLSDPSTRQRMEEHLTGDLKERGYNAVAASNEYGPKTFRNMSEEAVLEKIQNSGFDAVVTIVLLDKQKERYYVPGQAYYYSPYSGYYRHFWGYYNTMYNRVYTPGYYITNTKYFWESNLYDVSSKELVYSVQTESFDPASSEALAHEYGKLIVNDMVKHQVLTRKELMAKDGQ